MNATPVLAQLLKATNRLSDAEPLMRRALTIDEASFGPEHPNVARDLNILAALLSRAAAFRGNGACSAAHYFVGTGA